MLLLVGISTSFQLAAQDSKSAWTTPHARWWSDMERAKKMAAQLPHQQADPAADIANAQGGLTIFDVPSAVNGTSPAAINVQGDVSGGYCDATRCPGFLRDKWGHVTTFDITGSYGVGVTAMNQSNITGFTAGPQGILATGPGFLRQANGNITLFNPCSVGCFFTTPLGINSAGTMAGYYGNSAGFHGFLRSPKGQFTVFDVPGAVNGTYGSAINAAGIVAGAWSDANYQHGFVRANNGALTLFDPPAPTQTVAVYGINSSGTVAGYYCLSQCHGFVRNSQGVFVTFDPPGSTLTFCSGINDAGTTTGIYNDSEGTHVFLSTSDGTFTRIDVPGAVNGYGPVAIAPSGPVTVTGAWYDSSSTPHGFIFQSGN
jgi:hypothetical protein